ALPKRQPHHGLVLVGLRLAIGRKQLLQDFVGGVIRRWPGRWGLARAGRVRAARRRLVAGRNRRWPRRAATEQCQEYAERYESIAQVALHPCIVPLPRAEAH